MGVQLGPKTHDITEYARQVTVPIPSSSSSLLLLFSLSRHHPFCASNILLFAFPFRYLTHAFIVCVALRRRRRGHLHREEEEPSKASHEEAEEERPKKPRALPPGIFKALFFDIYLSATTPLSVKISSHHHFRLILFFKKNTHTHTHTNLSNVVKGVMGMGMGMGSADMMNALKGSLELRKTSGSSSPTQGGPARSPLLPRSAGGLPPLQLPAEPEKVEEKEEKEKEKDKKSGLRGWFGKGKTSPRSKDKEKQQQQQQQPGVVEASMLSPRKDKDKESSKGKLSPRRLLKGGK